MKTRTLFPSPLVAVALAFLATSALAGFSGTDVFLPSVGAKPGVAPAVWYTTVWVHNPNTTSANVTFYLLERQANLAPKSYTDTVPAGDTRRYDNAVKTMFGVETFGAIRVTSERQGPRRHPHLLPVRHPRRLGRPVLRRRSPRRSRSATASPPS